MLHMIRPPQDVGVLAVLDFQNSCYRHETDDYKDWNKGLKDPGQRGLRSPEEPCI